MVLSVHPHVDLEAFLVLFECFFVLALRRANSSNIMVRVCHEWMVAFEHPELDLNAFVMLEQRVFVVILQLVQCPDVIV